MIPNPLIIIESHVDFLVLKFWNKYQILEKVVKNSTHQNFISKYNWMKSCLIHWNWQIENCINQEEIDINILKHEIKEHTVHKTFLRKANQQNLIQSFVEATRNNLLSFRNEEMYFIYWIRKRRKTKWRNFPRKDPIMNL